jgi:Glycosyltransferase family 87
MTSKPTFPWISLFLFIYPAHLVAQSYQMDFRVFYVAAHCVVRGLDPYLNPVGLHPELFAASNADYHYPSGFIYPPVAALLLSPLGLISSYDVARVLFSLFLIVASVITFILINRLLTSRGGSAVSHHALLFSLVSLPYLANFERGQIDLILLGLVVLTFYLYTLTPQRGLAAFLLAIASQLKVFPGFLLIYFIQVEKDWRFVMQFLGTILTTNGISYIFFGQEVYYHFLQRSFPQFFGSLTGSEIAVENPQHTLHGYIVKAIDGNYKILSHDFVNGRMNPLFIDHTFLAFFVGIFLLILTLFLTRKKSRILRFFQCLTFLNLLNPRSWVMGLVWYFPLFFYLFDRFEARFKPLLFLPLFLPPFLELNAYCAIVIALLSTQSHWVKHLHDSHHSHPPRDSHPQAQ